jgi:hypothetical protein
MLFSLRCKVHRKASFRSQGSPFFFLGGGWQSGIGTSLFFLVIWFYPFSIIPPMVHNDIFLNITVFISQGQAGEALELSNEAVIRMSRSTAEESTFRVLFVKGL